MRGVRRRLLALGLALALAAVAGCATPARTTVTVLTRNLYLGTDINRPIRAAYGRSGSEALLALGRADERLARTVERTDFAVRSRLLAAELATARPDLVGLQEVALWRHGPLQVTPGPTTADAVDQDFLALLLAATRAAGVAYDVVRSQDEADVEAPAFAQSPTEAGARDVRLTMRDVILVRHDAALRIEGTGSGQYARRLELSLAGRDFVFSRGYAWVDVVAGSARFRFVTTHLESVSAAYAGLQAGELTRGPLAAGRPVVVVCDCNAPPGAEAYDVLQASGLVDAWTAVHGDDPGATGVLSETLDDPAPRFSRRLDLVLTRRTPTHPLEASSVQLVGETVAARDPATGLWPSDHAGVMATVSVG